MSTKQRLFLAMVFVLGLVSLCLVWPKKTARNLSVTFAGFTTNGAGGQWAQFSISNRFSRRVRFGICELQWRGTNGWPDWTRVAGGAAWLAVAPGGERTFSVPVPTAEAAHWRVPFAYQEDLSLSQEVRFRLDLLAWGLWRWRPGRPLPVRHGDSYHRTFFAYGPEMAGASNPAVQLPSPERHEPSNAPPSY